MASQQPSTSSAPTPQVPEYVPAPSSTSSKQVIVRSTAPSAPVKVSDMTVEQKKSEKTKRAYAAIMRRKEEDKKLKETWEKERKEGKAKKLAKKAAKREAKRKRDEKLRVYFEKIYLAFTVRSTGPLGLSPLVIWRGALSHHFCSISRGLTNIVSWVGHWWYILSKVIIFVVGTTKY